MAPLKVEKLEQMEKKYLCECCYYITSRKEHYEKHLATQKHKKTEILTNPNNKVEKVINEYVCMCGKQYKHRQSLAKHQKKCDYEEPICVEIKKSTDVSGDVSGDVLALLMEQNKLLTEQNKQ